MAEQISRRRFVMGATSGSLIAPWVSPVRATTPLPAQTKASQLSTTTGRARRSNINISIGDVYKDRKFCVKAGSRIVRDVQSGGGGNAEWYQNINADHYPTESQVGVTFYTN
jgi:hypothetical protein